MFNPCSIFAIILAILFAATPSFADRYFPFGAHHTAFISDIRTEQPLQQLLSAFITRPGITLDSDRRALLPAIHNGAEAFNDSLRHDKRLHRFSHDIKPLLAAYNAEMASAVDGQAGAEARGAAMDRLLAGILHVANQANIYPEELEMALLKAAAAIEKSMLRRPATRALTLEDRELITLLLLNSIHQVHRRTVLMEEPISAMVNLGTDPSLVATYVQRFTWCGQALANELVSLEKNISDPTFIGDLNKLIMMQFNTEALNDMFSLKIELESFSLANGIDLTTLAGKMASMGGIMSDMTANRLKVSGVVPLNFLTIAAYNWVTPSTPLNYIPDFKLPNELALLGISLTAAPDFSLFATPYRDIFQLRYDLFLCDQITAKEWQDAEDRADVVTKHPLTMVERLSLRKADATRRQAVLSRLKGATPQEKHSLRILLSHFFGK